VSRKKWAQLDLFQGNPGKAQEASARGNPDQVSAGPRAEVLELDIDSGPHFFARVLTDTEIAGHFATALRAITTGPLRYGAFSTHHEAERAARDAIKPGTVTARLEK